MKVSQVLLILCVVMLLSHGQQRIRRRPNVAAPPRSTARATASPIQTVRAPSTSALSRQVRAEQGPLLEAAFAERGLKWGAPIFLRFHKYNNTKLQTYFDQFSRVQNRFLNHYFYSGATLEVWVESAPGAKYVLFNAYPVCVYSGKLGPKKREGDGQSPEGFYEMTASLFNPNSAYRLSVNVGYPNRRDRALRHTGGLVMVHGECASVGCLAMNDLIDPVYTLLERAILGGQQKIPFHAFPFAMTEENIARASMYFPQHEQFWRQIAVGWRAFEKTNVPPDVTVKPTTGDYVVQERGEPLPNADDEGNDDNNEMRQVQ